MQSTDSSGRPRGAGGDKGRRPEPGSLVGIDGVSADAAVLHGGPRGGDARDVAVLQVEAAPVVEEWGGGGPQTGGGTLKGDLEALADDIAVLVHPPRSTCSFKAISRWRPVMIFPE